MAMYKRLTSFVLTAIVMGIQPAHAQSTFDLSQIDLSRLDKGAAISGANDVLKRAPDASIDQIFQSTLMASRQPKDRELLCQMLNQGGVRNSNELFAFANRLSEDSRNRYLESLINVALDSMQAPVQKESKALGERTLKQAGVVAMLTNDSFMQDIMDTQTSASSQEARCRATGLMLEILKDFKLEERAAATRYLLSQGLSQVKP